jgi:hypothetical protein
MDNNVLLDYCLNGHLSKLIELYNTGIIDITDIRANNDILFKSACRFNYPMIAKWLVSICNDYEIIDIHHRRGIVFGIQKTKKRLKFSEMCAISECSICLEFSEHCIITGCGHIFCNGCITRWCNEHNHNNCPMCRREIS